MFLFIVELMINVLKKIPYTGDGNLFLIRGITRAIKGTLAAMSADNLASCALGGFKEGSTAEHGCRQCMTTPDDKIIAMKVLYFLY